MSLKAEGRTKARGACTVVWGSDVGRVEQVLRHELFIHLRMPGPI